MGELDLEQIKGKLFERRRMLSGDVRQLADELKNASEAGGTAGLPSEIADRGQVTAEQDLAFSRMASEGDEIGQIDEALAKIEAGEFGACDECGKAINPARLEALPHARLCLMCQQELERRAGEA